MPQADPKPQDLGYTAASRELDAILDAIEAGQTDIDVLSEKVERAAFLIRHCRERLAGAELRVKKVVDELSQSLGDEPDTDQSTEPDAEPDER